MKMNDPDKVLKEFMSEVKILSELDFVHPNLVRFIGACVEQPDLCIITEFIHNGSLYDYIRDNDITDKERLRIALNIARGMEYMHSTKKVPAIHRDLKSLNVLVSKDYSMKICDFGLTVMADNEEALKQQVGTVRWTAPEILKGEKYTHKVDNYAFAIMLWELFTKPAVVPFEGMTANQVKTLIVDGNRPPMPKCPEKIRVLIESGWDKDSEKRPSFTEFIKILEEIHNETP